VVTRRIAVGVFSAALFSLCAGRLDAHPLHTTLTEVTITPSRTIRATVRVFADDLAAGMGKTRRVALDADVATFVTKGLALYDAERPLALRVCGIKRQADLLWVCLETAIAGAVDKVSLRNSLLGETFKDQINIVQVASSGAKRSLVFTRDDGAKRLF
jgi:4-hydroxy-3-methylbut-2-en-1-yl diphosphate synthase IspG/GcpE